MNMGKLIVWGTDGSEETQLQLLLPSKKQIGYSSLISSI
jgi:hypothetical protein